MVTVYLHIGTAKTGTTTLQRFLCKHETLLCKLGYLYPKAGRPTNNPTAHYHLANALRAEGKIYNRHIGAWVDISTQFTDLHQEIIQRNLPNVIISCESFSNNPNDIEQLKQELSAYNVKILVYLREQKKFLLSAYIESVKQGSSLRFEEYVGRNLNLVDYCNLLALWGKVFGKENLIIRVFEKERLQGTLFEDFLLSIGIQDASRFNTSIVNYNVSPPSKTINLLRYLNSIAIAKLSVPYHVCRWTYINRLLYSQRWQALSLKLPNFLISEELNPDFELYSEKFREINQKIVADYFPSQRYSLFSE